MKPTNFSFAGKESMRGMGGGMMGSKTGMMGGGMMDKPTAPKPIGAPKEADQSEAGYTGPDQRCNSCEYFNPEDNSCAKGVNGGTVDPEGHSNLYEPRESEAQPDNEETE